MLKLVYVCGGMFAAKNPTADKPLEFNLVRPSGRGSLPYVAHTEENGNRLFNLVQHHSHLYSLNMETGEMILQRVGQLDGPRNCSKMPDDLLAEVKQATPWSVYDAE